MSALLLLLFMVLCILAGLAVALFEDTEEEIRKEKRD